MANFNVSTPHRARCLLYCSVLSFQRHLVRWRRWLCKSRLWSTLRWTWAAPPTLLIYLIIGHRDDSKPVVWRFGALSHPRCCQMKALSSVPVRWPTTAISIYKSSTSEGHHSADATCATQALLLGSSHTYADENLLGLNNMPRDQGPPRKQLTCD